MQFRAIFTGPQREVLSSLRERDRREREAGDRGEMSLKALAPEVAELLYMLVVHKGAKTIVEFGTSQGYSTIYLAAAAERTGGHVYTVDAMPEKTGLAAANLDAAGLMDRVTLTTSDGCDFARSLPSGIDLTLVDYAIPAFLPAFPHLRERMSQGALLFVDGGPDGYWDRDDVRPFRTALEEDAGFVVSMVPMRKQQLVAVRIAEAASGLRTPPR